MAGAGADAVSAWVRVVDLGPLLNSAGGNERKNTSGREREAAV
jgi:hypothetical protein